MRANVCGIKILTGMLILMGGSSQMALAHENGWQKIEERAISVASCQESFDWSDWQEELDSYDFTELEQMLNEWLPDSGLTFRQVAEQMIKGDVESFWQAVGNYAKQILWGQVIQGKEIAWQILLLVAVGAVFTNLTRAFSEKGVSQSGFFVLYMVLAVLLLTFFSTTVTMTVEGLTVMGRLMTAFLPTFFLVVAVQGQLTAAAMYEFALLLLRGIQWLYCQIVPAGIRIWVLLRIVDGIFTEEILTHLAELMGKGMKTMVKSGFGLAVGFQTIQALLFPYLDAVKGGMLVRLAGAIPGVGNSISSAAQMALGTAALLRNGIGMAGVVVLLLVSVGPLLQLGASALLYHGLAALLQPISDKRIVGAVSAVGDGSLLLMKVLGAGVLLSGIFIGIVCACLGRI